MIYLCHPLKNDLEKNLCEAEKFVRTYCERACAGEQIKNIRTPIKGRASFNYYGQAMPFYSPLYLFNFLNDRDNDSRKLAFQWDLKLIKTCEEFWILGNFVSEGMRLEIAQALKHNRPIFWIDLEKFYGEK